jgi:SAM-dependent methyltransferase
MYCPARWLACEAMPDRSPTEFDPYRASYREAVERSIAFARTELDFFTRAKVRALLALVAQRVGDPSRLSFLDVGCGPGETDRFLEGRVGRLTGVDVASRLVDVAQEQNPWAEYRAIRPGEPLPYPTQAFDVSFAVCVLHHVGPPQRPGLVREMARVTRSGGLVAIFEHNPWNPLTRRAVAGCEFDEDAVLLTRREAGRLLRDSALAAVEGSYILFFTRESTLLSRIERRLGQIPLGAQYVVSGRRG